MYLAIIGKDNIENGLNIIGSHADSPRLDLKPNPLYEDSELAFFKTHYYGGIKKYQWTTIPLAIHGVIVKANGEKVEIKIGEDETDPIFTITDLLPHLAQDQMEKKLKNGIDGEDLNLLVGSIPYDKEMGRFTVGLIDRSRTLVLEYNTEYPKAELILGRSQYFFGYNADTAEPHYLADVSKKTDKNVYSVAVQIKADVIPSHYFSSPVCYTQEELMPAALKLAGKIAKNAPIAVRNCKKAINDGISLPIEKAVEVEEKLFGDCFETHDQVEGMSCFLSREKPKPKAVFTNN